MSDEKAGESINVVRPFGLRDRPSVNGVVLFDRCTYVLYASGSG